MLQIISKKFFKSEDLIETECKGILYSNFSWIKPIHTCVAALEPVEPYMSPITSYVMSYTNCIEKDPPQSTVQINRIGDAEIVEQFRLLCIFGLRAYFHTYRDSVELNCRKLPRSPGDKSVPSHFVPRLLDYQLTGKRDEIERFMMFVDKVIGLPRKKYLSVVTSLRGFAHALEILNRNLDLAYSLLVYSLESLGGSFDEFTIAWDDYDPPIRDKLDKYLRKDSIDERISNDIRNILLQATNLRLAKRFVEFATKHVSDSFFTDEATDTRSAVRRSELEEVLKNAYHMRSRFVHELRPIQEHLKIPDIAQGEVFPWENKPYLTFRGLVRVVHHVTSNFIQKQECVESEDYDWRSELPGVILMEVAPEYWIWQTKGFEPSQATGRFSGFLSHIQQAILSNGSLADLRKLFEKFESVIPTAKKKDRIPMLAMYYLYHFYVVQEARRPDHEKFLKQYEDVFDECSIEMMIVHLLSNQKWPWDVEKCVSHYRKYRKKTFSKNTLSIPSLMELCLIVQIANMYLKTGEIDKYEEWLNIACLEATGKPEHQKLINECKSKGIDVNYALFLKRPETKSVAK